jgi:ATP-dependent protease ClpP protease subunit
MRLLLLSLFLTLSRPPAASLPPAAVFHLEHDIVGGEAVQLTELVKWAKAGGATELVVMIDSEGGDAAEGLRLYRAIKASPLPTRCEVRGEANSAAAVVLMACQQRWMTKTSHIGIHNPFARVPVPTVITVEQSRLMADALEATSNTYAALIASRMHMPLTLYRARIANGALWVLDAVEAMKSGAIDRVIE